MLNESRIKIYDYLYNLFYGTVTENVYSMSEPQELTANDAANGFIVIRVGQINDDSEFSREAYGWVRCYVDAYVPPISRGRLDYEKYKEMEDAINTVVNYEAAHPSSDSYSIEEGSMLSYDDEEDSNADNIYFLFIRSFIVTIDEIDENN